MLNQRREHPVQEQWKKYCQNQFFGENEKLYLQKTGTITALCLVGLLAGSMAIPAIGAQARTQEPDYAISDSNTEETEFVSEEDENALIEQALLRYSNESNNVLKNCSVSWYTQQDEYRTSSGFFAAEGCTIRVNTEVIPLLSDVCIAWPDGTREWYKASDGGARGNTVSIFTQNPVRVQNESEKTATVYWIPEGAIT